MATKKTPDHIPPAVLARYEKLVATHPKVERKGANVPYTSVNGHMFSYLGADGSLALRLSSADRDAFIEKYDTTLANFGAMVMKEYVAVPNALLAKTNELKPYFARSYDYVSGLKPKPTTRKKTSGAAKKTAARKTSSGGKKTSSRKA